MLPLGESTSTLRHWVGLLCCLSTLLAGEAVAQSEGSCRSAGRVDGITVSGARRDAVDVQQGSLTRAGTTVVLANGAPVCYRDIIKTGIEVTVRVRLDEAPENEKEITFYSDTTAEIIDGNSVLLKLGRMFASLRGRFDVRTVFALLGARGTEFQVAVGPDELDVVQLAGSLDIQPSQGSLSETSPVQQGRGLGFNSLSKDGASFLPKRPQAGPLQLERLTRLTLSKDAPPMIVAAGEGLVRKVTESSSLALIATRPDSPSQNLIQNFRSAEMRAQVFREAYFYTFWAPADHRYFEQLGNAYADWGEANRAMRAYQVSGKREFAGRDLAHYYNNLGNIYRLSGDTRTAEELYEKALSVDSHFAFPYNGLGDVYRDRALAAIDRKEQSQGRASLDKAQQFYKRSLDRTLWGKEGGHNRAVPLYNLGEVYLQLGDLAGAEPKGPDVKRAQQYFAEATKSFREALGESNEFPFALVGLGRTFEAEARALARAGRKGEAEESIARAESHLRSVLDRFPSFAVASRWLGEVLELRGEREQAARHFFRATQLDPQYAPAYFRFAQALYQTNPELARLYYQTYLRLESPIFRNGTRVKTAEERIKGSPPPPPPPPGPSRIVKVPDVVGDSKEKAVQKLGKRALVAQIREEIGCEKFNRVVAQDPKEGTRLPEKSRVLLIVSSPGDTPVAVPSVAGLQLEVAESRIRETGLSVRKIDREIGRNVTPGTVLRQRPDAFTQTGRGCFVDLTIAVPVPQPPEVTELVRVPKFVGMSIAQARRYLPTSFAGSLTDFRMGNITEVESRYSPGTILSQQPLPGTRVPRGAATPINLVISRGARLQPPDGAPAVENWVQVPNVVNLGLKTAVEVLKRYGLNYQIAPGGDIDIVADQSPKAGTRVSRGSTVRLFRRIG